jgi:hypothetical protein
MPEGGTVMGAEPLQGLSASVLEGRKDHFRPDSSEEAIQACYDLLSSGYPLSDILVALKQLGPLNKHSQSESGVESSDTEIADIAGEGLDAPSQWRTVQVTQAVETRLPYQSHELSGALVCAGGDVSPGDASRSLVALTIPPSHRVENGVKFCRPIWAVLVWLIPAISLTVVGIAGKLLIDANLILTTTEATVVSNEIPGNVAGTVNLTPPQAEPAETRAVPAISEVNRTAPDVEPNRPVRPNSPPVTGSRRSAQSRHTPIQRPFSMEWKMPSRLTDGF